MNFKCKALAVVMVIAMVITVIPATVLAAAFNTDSTRIMVANNGDNNTPYNLQWDDGAKGIISFETQHAADYYTANPMAGPSPLLIFSVELFRDGESIEFVSIEATEITGRKVTMDISKYMKEPGVYYFEASLRANSSAGTVLGKIAQSFEYVLSASSTPEAQVIGNTNETPNGDGYTPYNLRWSNPVTGEIAHDVQRASGNYRIWVYRNGEIIGSHGTGYAPGYDPYPGSYTTSLASFLTEPGVYHFTAQYVTIRNGLEVDTEGLEIHSPEYVYGGAVSSNVMGDPSNLRMEVIDNENLMLRWDAPDDWAEGRDSFVLWAYSVGGGPGSASATENAGSSSQMFSSATEYQYNLPTGKVGDRQNIEVMEGTWEGPYIFSVQSVSGDTTVAASGINVFSTMAYDRNQGVIPWAYAGLAPNERVDGSASVSLPPAATPPAQPSALDAKPTASTVFVNGKEIEFDAYNIGGNNYFKLRDLAYALNGTEARFEVGWDSANNAINLTSGQPYSGANEMQAKGSGVKSALPTTSRIYVDGGAVTLTAYNIESNNYFMLRELGDVLGFSVDWDGDTNSILITTGN